MPISMKRTLPSLLRQDNHLSNTLPIWFVMTDHERLADPTPLIPYLPRNSALIIRDLDMGRQSETMHQLTPLCQKYGAILMASLSRPPRQLLGDGIHIPEKSLCYWKQTDILRLQPKIITASAHSLSAICRAARFGVDACLLSPVFPTKSHADGASLGMQRFATLCRQTELPIIGLGGISSQHVRRVFLGGAAGIAGIGLFDKFRQEGKIVLR